MSTPLRRFAVCRHCSEIYPSRLGCPDCDNDELARFEMANARSGYVVPTPLACSAGRQRTSVPSEPPVEGMRPKMRRLMYGSPTEPASLAWLRRNAASLSVTIVMCTTLLLIVLHLS